MTIERAWERSWANILEIKNIRTQPTRTGMGIGQPPLNAEGAFWRPAAPAVKGQGRRATEGPLHSGALGYDMRPQPAPAPESVDETRPADALDDGARRGGLVLRLRFALAVVVATGATCRAGDQEKFMQPRAARFALFVGLCVFLTIPALTSAQASVPRLLIQPVDENHLTVLNGNTHPMARAQFDRGAAPPNLPMDRMLLVLKRSPEQETALRKLLDDQQDKASPSYHKWLTPDEFGQQFGPSDQDIQVVTGWLQSHGFQVAQVAKGRAVIEFYGTAAQVQEAFHTAIHKFVVNGEDHWANANDPQIPAALTPVVAGVHTLHNFLKKPMHVLSSERTLLPPRPFPQITGRNGSHALVPGDYAVIYNINPVYSQGIRGDG